MVLGTETGVTMDGDARFPPQKLTRAQGMGKYHKIHPTAIEATRTGRNKMLDDVCACFSCLNGSAPGQPV